MRSRVPSPRIETTNMLRTSAASRVLSRSAIALLSVIALFSFGQVARSQSTLALGTNNLEFSAAFEVLSITLNGHTYSQSDIIQPQLDHIHMSSSSAYDGPHTASPRSALLEDFFVNTGADNLGSGTGGFSDPPDTTVPGMILSFAGLTNGPGYDIVFVDRYSADAFILCSVPAAGAPAELSISSGQYGPPMLDMDYFRNPFNATPTTLSQFNNNASSSSTRYVHSYVQAVAIDLSALGFAIGDRVERLFFQDDAAVSGVLDPVLVVGLRQLSGQSPRRGTIFKFR